MFMSHTDKHADEPILPERPDIVVAKERPTLTLSMVLKNEGSRYLRQALEQHRQYIDQAVLIDDGSTDDTISICLDTLQGIPVKLIRNVESRFHNEIVLRKQQWAETIKAEPGWILNLDADEWFEQRFTQDIKAMLHQQEVDVYCFRLYDFWSDTHYREDEYWNAHRFYRPFLLRYQPGFVYKWKETPQHCGRFPENILDLPHKLSDIRLKHYGWAKPEDRLAKHERYMRLDPGAKYGIERQYSSILDERPSLLEWIGE
jgi:glycosyltransferase involved in cell wall biosynthesis